MQHNTWIECSAKQRALLLRFEPPCSGSPRVQVVLQKRRAEIEVLRPSRLSHRALASLTRQLSPRFPGPCHPDDDYLHVALFDSVALREEIGVVFLHVAHASGDYRLGRFNEMVGRPYPGFETHQQRQEFRQTFWKLTC